MVRRLALTTTLVMAALLASAAPTSAAGADGPTVTVLFALEGEQTTDVIHMVAAEVRCGGAEVARGGGLPGEAISVSLPLGQACEVSGTGSGTYSYACAESGTATCLDDRTFVASGNQDLTEELIVTVTLFVGGAQPPTTTTTAPSTTAPPSDVAPATEAPPAFTG